MKYTTKASEKSTVKITLKFDAEEFKSAQTQAYLKSRHKFSINGFRKGKAPKNVIENVYGKGVFYEDALNILFGDNYGNIIEKCEKKFTVVGDPDVSVEDFSEEGVTLVAVVPVKPEVKISSYTGMKIKEYAYTVKDEEIDADINRVLDRNARKVPVEGRPAQLGDIANIDFVGTVDGVKFDGGEAEGFDLTLGSGQFIPGFEDQVVGMNVGDKKDVNVTFPENYQAENLKGKPAVFAVTLNSLQAKELPELTDEFIKDATGSESVEAYKAKAKERLQKQADARSNDATENSILEAIAQNAEAEIPDAMIEREIDNQINEYNYRLQMQGMSLDMYMQYTGMDIATLRANYKEGAEKQVKLRLALEKIIELEKIEISDEDVETELKTYADSYGMKLEEVKKYVPVEDVKADLGCRKAMDVVKDNAKAGAAKKKAEPKAEETADEKTAKKTATKKAATEKKPAAKKTTSKKKTEEAKAE